MFFGKPAGKKRCLKPEKNVSAPLGGALWACRSAIFQQLKQKVIFSLAIVCDFKPCIWYLWKGTLTDLRHLITIRYSSACYDPPITSGRDSRAQRRRPGVEPKQQQQQWTPPQPPPCIYAALSSLTLACRRWTSGRAMWGEMETYKCHKIIDMFCQWSYVITICRA